MVTELPMRSFGLADTNPYFGVRPHNSGSGMDVGSGKGGGGGRWYNPPWNFRGGIISPPSIWHWFSHGVDIAVLFHVVIYILQAVYTAIDTDQLVKEIDMLVSVIKATEPNIKNVMSLDNYLELVV